MPCCGPRLWQATVFDLLLRSEVYRIVRAPARRSASADVAYARFR
jgi:hypothetical protein